MTERGRRAIYLERLCICAAAMHSHEKQDMLKGSLLQMHIFEAAVPVATTIPGTDFLLVMGPDV